MTKKVKALIEHYIIAVVAAGAAIWQTGNHDLKKVSTAALVGILGPVAKAAWDKVKTTVK